MKVMALRNPLVVAWLHHPDTPDVSAPPCSAREPVVIRLMNMRAIAEHSAAVAVKPDTRTSAPELRDLGTPGGGDLQKQRSSVLVSDEPPRVVVAQGHCR